MPFPDPVPLTGELVTLEPHGVLRQHRRMPDGSLRDTVVYSILDTEWPAVRNGLRARLGRGPGRSS